jgi:hypothetical protein
MAEGYDARGRQRSIFRLAGFDYVALIHMLFYRILVFFAIIAGAAILASLFLSPSSLGMQYAGLLVLGVWILITPQLFEAMRAVGLMLSGGRSSGDLNKSFANFAGGNRPYYAFCRSLPYATLTLWIAGFVIMLVILT